MTQTSRHEFIVTPAGNDLVIYDQARHVTHHLNQTAAHIWQEAERTIDADVIASRLALPVDTVRDALDQLAQADLQVIPANMGRQSRRGLLKRAAMAGVVAPVVISVTAPMAAAQSSPCTTPPAPSISITYTDGGEDWMIFVNGSGFCPNTNYPASRYTRLSNGTELGPYAAPGFAGESGGWSDLIGTFDKGGGNAMRYDVDGLSTGWVTAPS